PGVRPLRVLPAPPTRRSSDLGGGGHWRGHAILRMVVASVSSSILHAGAPTRTTAGARNPPSYHHPLRSYPHPPSYHHPPIRRTQDRKSTRLNTSHVSSSYAVS